MAYDFPVLFFDGECNLCDHAVQFVIRHDRQGKIKFASLQSAAGLAAQLEVKKMRGIIPDSLIFYSGGKFLAEADAALGVAAMLDGGWKRLAALRILPQAFLNRIYRIIAKHRLKWFGRRDSCMMPTPELKARFLD